MKKLVLFMVMLAVALGTGIASADKVYIPLSFHYGNSNYDQVLVTNLGTQAARVSVTFDGSLATSAGSVMTTNTFSSSTSKTVVVGGGQTWIVLSNETSLFGATTSMKRAQVIVQSSATDDPMIAPVRAHSFFIHVGTTPSGFIFPANYRVRTWNSSQTTCVTCPKIDQIKQ